MSIESIEMREQKQVSEKAVYIGTHRACPPEVTLAHVQPFLSEMGITRVADVTYLDDLGIPVFQAIRPNSRNLSVSQGKGLTPILAKVSAIMESIETWHAEQPDLVMVEATIGEMAACLPYSIYDLNLAEQHVLHPGFLLKWLAGRLLDSGAETFVPAGYVRLDLTVQNAWLPPTFNLTSNGLASGNTLDEATLHGLYEVIERDTLAQIKIGKLQELAVDPATVDGSASAQLIELLRRAGADFELKFAAGPTGIPCFIARVISSNYPIVSLGYGCHLDRDVALSRAITEAAQSRLTMIAGARDDIGMQGYARIRSRRKFATLNKAGSRIDFHDVSSVNLFHLAEDLQEVTQRFLASMDCTPIVVNLTRPEFAIPVVFVAAPQLRFLETHK